MSKRQRPVRRASRDANATHGRARSFDLEGMSRAIRSFLESAGIDLAQPELAGTPERVARAWNEEFLDGYEADPGLILQDSFAANGVSAKHSSGMVVVKGVPFHGLCPHHLLPYHGLAHIGYLPSDRLAPFSGLVRLLDCFAHRLEVQETVTQQVAEALTAHLGAKGAAAVLESEQTCMTLRGVKRRGTRTVTSHFSGAFTSRPDLRNEFLRSIGKFE
ncbi:MAG: GTP cyclohydrolase I [Acidobacteriota bacterium]